MADTDATTDATTEAGCGMGEASSPSASSESCGDGNGDLREEGQRSESDSLAALSGKVFSALLKNKGLMKKTTCQLCNCTFSGTFAKRQAYAVCDGRRGDACYVCAECLVDDQGNLVDDAGLFRLMQEKSWDEDATLTASTQKMAYLTARRCKGCWNQFKHLRESTEPWAATDIVNQLVNTVLPTGPKLCQHLGDLGQGLSNVSDILGDVSECANDRLCEQARNEAREKNLINRLGARVGSCMEYVSAKIEQDEARAEKREAAKTIKNWDPAKQTIEWITPAMQQRRDAQAMAQKGRSQMTESLMMLNHILLSHSNSEARKWWGMEMIPREFAATYGETWRVPQAAMQKHPDLYREDPVVDAVTYRERNCIDAAQLCGGEGSVADLLETVVVPKCWHHATLTYRLVDRLARYSAPGSEDDGLIKQVKAEVFDPRGKLPVDVRTDAGKKVREEHDVAVAEMREMAKRHRESAENKDAKAQKVKDERERRAKLGPEARKQEDIANAEQALKRAHAAEEKAQQRVDKWRRKQAAELKNLTELETKFSSTAEALKGVPALVHESLDADEARILESVRRNIETAKIRLEDAERALAAAKDKVSKKASALEAARKALLQKQLG